MSTHQSKTVSEFAGMGLKFFAGSEKVANYLLLAEDTQNGARLGARVLFEAAGKANDLTSYLIVRLRAEPLKEADSKSWGKGLTHIHWEKRSAERRSTVLMVRINRKDVNEIRLAAADLRASTIYFDIWSKIFPAGGALTPLVGSTVFEEFCNACVLEALQNAPVPNDFITAAALGQQVKSIDIEIERLHKKRSALVTALVKAEGKTDQIETAGLTLPVGEVLYLFQVEGASQASPVTKPQG